ncbi:MAG: dTMP kinase [Clostridia bacterium]|nr:dTMP kinase [Clostridia bacterium]
MNYKSKFITFEGGEAVGKTTQIKMVKEWLKSLGVKSLFTREPGGVVIAERIREILLTTDINKEDYLNKDTELLLYTAARSEVVQKLIKPELEKGSVVICDRFFDSTAAYQGYARGLGIDKIYKLQEIVLGKFGPDKTILYLMDPEKAFKRRSEQEIKKDRMESEKMDFHKRVYEGYKIIAQKFPERVVEVDASEGIEEVHKKTIEIVKNTIELEM